MQRTAARGHCQQVDSHQVEVIRPSFAWVRVDARAPGHNPLTSSAYLRKGQPLNPSDEPTLPPVGTKGACLRKSDEQFGCGEKRLVETPPIGELANPLYDPDLVEAVTNLSIAPPQGKAALNTRSLGRWLLAHRVDLAPSFSGKGGGLPENRPYGLSRVPWRSTSGAPPNIWLSTQSRVQYYRVGR